MTNAKSHLAQLELMKRYVRQFLTLFCSLWNEEEEETQIESNRIEKLFNVFTQERRWEPGEKRTAALVEVETGTEEEEARPLLSSSRSRWENWNNKKGGICGGKLLGGLLLKKLSTGTREEVFQVLSHFLSRIKIKLFLWIESGWLLLEENKQNKRIPMMNYCLQ